VEPGEIVVVDARSSDAIALALRTGAPIYTSAAVLDEVAVRSRPETNASTSRARFHAAQGQDKVRD